MCWDLGKFKIIINFVTEIRGMPDQCSVRKASITNYDNKVTTNYVNMVTANYVNMVTTNYVNMVTVNYVNELS